MHVHTWIFTTYHRIHMSYTPLFTCILYLCTPIYAYQHAPKRYTNMYLWIPESRQAQIPVVPDVIESLCICHRQEPGETGVTLYIISCEIRNTRDVHGCPVFMIRVYFCCHQNCSSQGYITSMVKSTNHLYVYLYMYIHKSNGFLEMEWSSWVARTRLPEMEINRV